MVSVAAISIHALREEGDEQLSKIKTLLLRISIHALREEGDRAAQNMDAKLEISIHALREEGDEARCA